MNYFCRKRFASRKCKFLMRSQLIYLQQEESNVLLVLIVDITDKKSFWWMLMSVYAKSQYVYFLTQYTDLSNCIKLITTLKIFVPKINLFIDY